MSSTMRQTLPAGAAPSVVDRISREDLVQLVTDVGPVPMNVGAVLTLSRGLDGATCAALLAERVARIPRLRQRLVTPTWGLGRPYWLDDPAFDAAAHVACLPSTHHRGDDRLLALVAEAVTRPLPRSRPLWRAMVVTDAADEAVAVVLVLHHVLADGMGGLAMLARLVDEAEAVPPTPVRPGGGPPATVDLLRDRVHELARWPTAARTLAVRMHRGRRELGSRARRAPRCSLNAPTGPRRQVCTVQVELEPLHTAGRRYGATVNDLLLVAVAGAMAVVLRSRGEHVRELVISVPVAARQVTASGDLGNRVGVMPVPVPVTGPQHERVTTVAAATRARKTRARGSSSVLVGPAFRLLAAAGVFRWFVNRQRLVNSFLTNMVGPAHRVSLAGSQIVGIAPLTPTEGNVGVAFAALSYGGRLSVSVIVDPDVVPEVAALAAALRGELAMLVPG
jgi:diacylglycerol O-acyltransferase / wax synthase